MVKKLSLFLLLSTGIFSNYYSQYRSELDSSFLTVGEYYNNYLASYHSIVASESLPDSTLVYVAQITAGSGPSAMIKLKHDGSIDSSFATHGKLTYTINGSSPTVLGIKYYSGKLYLSGKVNRDKFVTRITPLGKIDSTFGTHGSTTIAYGTPIVDISNSFAMDKNGNCYLGARITNLTTSVTEIVISKILNTTGLIDNSFGTLGKASFNLPTGAISTFTDLAIDSSQHIIAACCGSNTGNNVVLLVSFNANGSLNTSFNLTGYKEYTFTSADNFQVASNKLETIGDKIIVIGDYLIGGDPKVFLMKIKKSGVYDSTFATNGTLVYSNGSLKCTATENCLTADSSILIAGGASYGIGSHCSLLKINKNGTIDSSFALNGMFLNQMGIRWEKNAVLSLSQYADGRVFLGGNSSDCDQGACHFTSSMARVKTDSVTSGEVIDTVQTSGISEHNIELELTFFPNPVQTGQKLYLPNNQQIDKLEIFALTGQKILSIQSPSKSVHIEQLTPPGAYFIQFTVGHTLVTKKLLIIR